MEYKFKVKKIELGDQLKDKIHRKFRKIEKFFDDDTIAHITIADVGKQWKVEVTIFYKQVTFRAEALNTDVIVSIEKTAEHIERQIRKNKTRLQKKMKGQGGVFAKEAFWSSLESESSGETNDFEEEEHTIVKSKKISMKPMDIEEALLQMELIGHDFFIFTNADTNDVSVVYKRKDGNYGLIEKE